MSSQSTISTCLFVAKFGTVVLEHNFNLYLSSNEFINPSFSLLCWRVNEHQNITIYLINVEGKINVLASHKQKNF